jgi:hypothetical protein
MEYDPEEGWNIPSREDWPDIEPIMADSAVALMLLAEDVVMLVGQSKGGVQHPIMCVSCSDVFYWACADSEPLPIHGFPDEDVKIIELYNECRKGEWGSAVWCCLNRGMRPQLPVEKAMRDAGIWDARMDALPLRKATA